MAILSYSYLFQGTSEPQKASERQWRRRYAIRIMSFDRLLYQCPCLLLWVKMCCIGYVVRNDEDNFSDLAGADMHLSSWCVSTATDLTWQFSALGQPKDQMAIRTKQQSISSVCVLIQSLCEPLSWQSLALTRRKANLDSRQTRHSCVCCTLNYSVTV